MEDCMAKDEISKDILINRLKKIEGQTRGIQKMIESGRDCEDILTQLVAVRSAVESVGALVLHNFMHFCFNGREGDKEPADINSLARALAIWCRVHIGE
jgi:CsoR family transcriptional regulator, copper-sensing transcriptional repressor